MSEALDLDAIEARANAATEGPWIRRGVRGKIGDEEGIIVGPDSEDAVAFLPVGSKRAFVYQNTALCDGAFISHARTDIPALIAEVRRLQAMIEELPDARFVCFILETEVSP